MNFAFLGIDSESILLARAAISAGHQIVWCGDLAEQGNLLEDLMGGVPEDWGDQWEVLYDKSACDAIIVGRGGVAPELCAEQINQLIKNEVAILVTFPVVDSVLKFYEIDMTRNESGAVLHHFNPLVEQQSTIQECSQWIQEQHPQIGAIEQVLWRRPLIDRSLEQTLWHFARDVEMLDRVAGRLNRLGAFGSPDEQATYAGLSVQLMGKSEVPVRWEVGPVEKSAWAQLMLVAQHGSVTVDFNELGQAMQLELNHSGESQATPIESVDAPQNALNRFIGAVQSEGTPLTTWSSALHAMELTDTIEISLRRGRMIDVHHQQLTEQMAFKGTMSAFGCGVLMVLPPLLLLAGWLGELAGLPVADYWPHGLLLLLMAFLVIQVLPSLLMKTPENASEANDVK